ncbi:MAG: DUF72 domain-containing protein, partial [Dehalococcoidia bacterium]|nr:DUF72 domain-containing protein [Dehalococcoidia bacterium]
KGLIDSSSFYPAEVKTPADRLRYYSDQFPLAEIDSSYHYFPTRNNVALWLDNTPPGFVFDIKVFSLFTQHPTQPGTIPRSLREKFGDAIPKQGNLYHHHLPPEALDELWRIFREAVGPIQAAGMLGAIVFQFPPWFHHSQGNLDYMAQCRERLPQHRMAVEFRQPGWLDEQNAEGTLAFLRRQGITMVCVDEPQGLPSSVSPIAKLTAPLGIVRFHGRNLENWEKKGIAGSERFNYLYSDAELKEWLPGIRRMAEQAEELHLVFKNKAQDFPVRNAEAMSKLLKGHSAL